MIVETLKFFNDKNKKKKVLNVLASFVTIFVLFSSLNAFAQTAETGKLDVVKGYQIETELTKSATGDPSYNAQTTTNNIVLGALNGAVQNIVPQALSNYQAIKDNPNIPTYAKNGLVGMADNSVIAMYNNYSGVNIPGYLASEWVPGYTSDTSIYAANDGYSYLQESNVDGLWDRIRMISYIFFVVILIAAGFMIMFRQKIGGQLAVSIFNTLPNVVIALILVTFSFAIVGLLLNFGVMLINIVSSILGVTADTAMKVNHPFSLWGILVNGDYWKANLSANVVTLTVPAVIGAVVAIFTATGGTAAAVVVPAVMGAVIGALVIAIIVSAIVIYASIRVYITLLTAYLGIILNTILAPIFLTVSAFPGQSNMAMDWFNRILKGVLTFPIVYFFINLGVFILKGDLNLGFPSGIMSGDFANVDSNGSPIGTILKAVLVIVLFFYAADAPKMLDDFIVVNGGKGAGAALEGVKKGMSRIPLIGSFFG